MRIAPILTTSGWISLSDRNLEDVKGSLPPLAEGKIWKYHPPPLGGPALRFASIEDGTRWSDSFVDGAATVEPNFVLPYINGIRNPDYDSAPYEVVIMVEADI